MVLQYDYGEDENSRSPVLKPINFKYTPPRSPNAFAPAQKPMKDPQPTGQESRKRNRDSRDTKSQPCQGDVVLLRHLDPNRPDIATTAGHQTLFPSDSERGDDGDDEAGAKVDDDVEANSNIKSSAHTGRRSPKRFQSDAQPSGRLPHPGGRMVADQDTEMPDAPPTGHDWQETGAARYRSKFDKPVRTGVEHARSPSYGTYDPPRRLERVETYPTGPGFTARKNPPITLPSVSDTIAASPQLRPHMLKAPQGSPQNLDTPSMVPLGSPRNLNQSLPSVQDLFAIARDEEIRNPNRARTTSISSTASALTSAPSARAPSNAGAGPSPRFFVNSSSPSSSSIFSSIGRVQTDPTPLLPPAPGNIRPLGHSSTNPADFAMHSGAATHPPPTVLSASSTTSTSTAAPTPNSTVDGPSSDRSATMPLPASPEDSTPGASSPTSTANTASGTTLYKCSHPGCRAPPFQTPYLLNSHRNVHSSDRPYFCPRKDCPRSLPGKGFKRKNEMLRHGLVHNSPGYVCPFCSPDKEHRYPRPDNLQRHVRMHHEDIDAEDSRLREVLGQRRTTGGGGGGGGGKNSIGSGLELADDSIPDAGASSSKSKAIMETGGGASQRGRRRKGTG